MGTEPKEPRTVEREIDERLARYGDEDQLEGLIALHERPEVSGDMARRVRARFLRLLAHQPSARERDGVGRFLVDHVQPADFSTLALEDPDTAADFCEVLFSFRFEDEARAARVQHHAQSLLKAVVRQYEANGALDRAFKLLQTTPHVGVGDPELVRLRGRAHLYEMRRARRHRSVLYAYMVVQALLVTLVFPLLFINAENGRIQDAIEETIDVDLESDTPRQRLTYRDGLYWSLITAASIGYGDITPRTNVGRILAAALGTMGVLTIGVMAGLILFWISPRRLHG